MNDHAHYTKHRPLARGLRPAVLSPPPLLPSAPATPRLGFTLIEMLIAMTLTLILVYAIAQFYAIVGDAVKDGRGMIEMNLQLRGCVEKLKDDLDRITVPATPWPDEGGAAGYLEIYEGAYSGTRRPASDWDVDGDYVPDAQFEFVDLDNDGKLDGFAQDVTTLLGDTDDVIGMTIRAGKVPFTGQYVQPYTLPILQNLGLAANLDGQLQRGSTGNPAGKLTNPISGIAQTTAPYAEVVWWTSFSDTNMNGAWNLNEPRFLHRRQLLIKPELNQPHPGDPDANWRTTPYYARILLTGTQLNNADNIYIYDLQQYADVSLRPVLGSTLTAGNQYVYFIANSLTDLCRRENRFMHQTAINGSFPYALDMNANFAGNFLAHNTLILPDDPASQQYLTPRHANGNSFSQYRWVLFDGGRKGEDVILSNTLAFDIRVFDPEAIIRSDGSSNIDSLQPGDAGYAYANANNFTGTHTPYPALGTGAYVDLGYGIGLANVLPQLPAPHKVTATNATNFGLLFTQNNAISTWSPTLGNSRFAGLPSAAPNFYPNLANQFVPGAYQQAIGFTWDTWTLAYERDGINQDFQPEQAAGAAFVLTDEGTDGLDNPNPPTLTNFVNGVDDAAERETVPPYAYPLRGIQVRIRLYDPGTRQVRQATVESDFITE